MKSLGSGVAPILCGLVMALTVATTGCGNDVQARTEAPSSAIVVQPAKHLIVAIDKSGSRSPEELKGDLALLGKLASQLNYGDKASVIDVCEEKRDEACRPWTVDVRPLKNNARVTPVDTMVLSRARKLFAQRLTESMSGRRARKTNLFATLRSVEDVALSSKATPTLVLFSDMIHDAEQLSFERVEAIPDSAAIAQSIADGRLPQLSRMCVSAVGVVDPGTELGLSVTRFWRTYFTLAGADIDMRRFRRFVSEESTLFCS